MRRTVALGGVVGLCVLAGAFAVALRPALLTAAVPGLESWGIDGDTVPPLLALSFGVYAVWIAFWGGRTVTAEASEAGGAGPSPGDSPDVFANLRNAPPETATTEDATVVGRAFDEAVAAAPEDPDAERQVRESLRAAVVAVETAESGEEPSDVVESGAWTTDGVAAAFVADHPDVPYSLRGRLRGWLDPEGALTDRVERSVAAVRERLDESEVTP